MGLLTKSKQLRDTALAKNDYNPNNEYDLQSNPVSKLLNRLYAAGYDVRNQPISIIEKIAQGSTLSAIGAERLSIEFSRRFLNNTTNDFVVNPNALFDKNPNSKFLSKRTDYKITPPTSKTTAGAILDYIGGNLGAINNQDTVELLASKNVKVGGYYYYKYLGQGQKQLLNTAIGYNYYGIWAKVNSTAPDGVDVRINTFLDGRDKPGEGQGLVYVGGNKGIVNINEEHNFLKDDKYTDADAGSAPIGFIQTIAKPYDEKSLDDFEFGRTEVDLNLNGQYRDKSSDLVWGDEATFPANAKRGLLYYTQNILKTRTSVAQVMNMTNKSYMDGDKVLYKGTECRSWTVRDQYDTLGKMIRYQGNGVDGSVLRDSVIPHQYPRKIDNEDDKRRYMLSFENLAWTPQDLTLMNVPECERGPDGGRLMWFPFYGVSINENVKGSWDTTNFMGRLEPIYSYNGVERTATLTFTLLMDHPMTINKFRGNEAAYFANCDGIANQNDSNIITNKKSQASNATPLSAVDTSVKEVVLNTATFADLTYYYPNDVFTIDTTYETSTGSTNFTNTPLNAQFSSQSDLFGVTLASKEANGTVFRLDGYASQLAKTDYNAKLGYKRAYDLMLYLVVICNANSTSNETKINLDTTKNFIDGSFSEKTVNDINITEVLFKDSLRNITFSLYSAGESTASVVGESVQNINLLEVKVDRRSTIVAIDSVVPTKPIADAAPAATPQQIQNTIDTNTTKDVVDNTNDNCFPFKELELNAPLPTGFESLDYFRAAFHSQTPEDFHKRLTFLQQIMRAGSTIKGDGNNQGKNSIFGRAPFAILRLGDFFHTKCVIFDINFDYSEFGWDMNPEGAGFQAMGCRVTMSLGIIGGQSLKTPIDTIQNSIDFNYYANSSFFGDQYYGDSTKGTGPKAKENEQVRINTANNK